MPRTNLTLTLTATPVIRDSDARYLLLIELRSSTDRLVGAAVVDPHDYDEP